MGIRMHLLMGYGLDLSQLLHLNKAMLNYERLEDPDLFTEWRKAVLGYAETYHDTMEKMIFHDAMKPPTCLADLVSYQDEFGDPDRLVLIPASSRKKFNRYGDMLDIHLYEAQHPDPDFGMTSEWIPHPGTLFPYVGLMKPNPEEPLGIEKYWVSCYRNHPDHKDAIAWAPWHLYFLIRTWYHKVGRARGFVSKPRRGAFPLAVRFDAQLSARPYGRLSTRSGGDCRRL